jgi:hypothetical protein
MGLEEGEHREAVNVGQGFVDDREVGLLGLGEVDADPPAGRQRGAVSLRLEVPPAALGEDPVLGDHEDQEPGRAGRCDHGADASGRALRDREPAVKRKKEAAPPG